METMKKPWKPKDKDIFWHIRISNGKPIPFQDLWYGNEHDLVFYMTGNCFQSRKEAEQNKDKYIDWLLNGKPITNWKEYISARTQHCLEYSDYGEEDET